MSGALLAPASILRTVGSSALAGFVGEGANEALDDCFSQNGFSGRNLAVGTFTSTLGGVVGRWTGAVTSLNAARYVGSVSTKAEIEGVGNIMNAYVDGVVTAGSSGAVNRY